MKQYFFILGNNPSLSVAEILAWMQKENVKWSNPIAHRDFFVVSTDADLSTDILNQLGGVVKFGEIITQIDSAKTLTSDWLVETISTGHDTGKIHFGFSVYPNDKKISFMLRGMGLEAKKRLREYKISSRLVMSKQENLSSVIVQKNKLVTNNGWEIVVLKNDKNFLVGRTFAVQPFEALGRRDFGRPDRDDFSGMLPPKLAQAMLNLAGQSSDACIVDPFCGSGTIVQEALLMGYKKVLGYDVSHKAVDDSKENIKWLADEFDIDISKVIIKQVDVRVLKQELCEVDAIVTEPYLGPPARGSRNTQDVQKIVRELTELYSQAFVNFQSILKSDGIVVMIFPVFAEKNKKIFMPVEKIVNMNFFDKIIPIPSKLQYEYALSKRNTLIYSRAYQKVQREIIILKKR